ncbi:MAG: GNAT family N-acetyltransferase [Pyrinomonadaceae bacterium]
MIIHSDKNLSQKIEATEGGVSAEFCRSRARLEPGCGSTAERIGGAFAMFDGPDSPLTQTFGLGMFEDADEQALESIENFFISRGADVFHEVSPLADPNLLAMLVGRGYQPIELSTVLIKPLAGYSAIANQTVQTRVVQTEEAELWAKTSARAWSNEMPELGDFMLNYGTISAHGEGAFPFLAEIDEEPVATGMLYIVGDMAFLAGASTVPEARKRGAQTALLNDRLAFAIEQGCAFAMMGAAPGSQSQRNAEKNGFRVAYTRTKWMLGRT